jgi:hypothetical protein
MSSPKPILIVLGLLMVLTTLSCSPDCHVASNAANTGCGPSSSSENGFDKTLNDALRYGDPGP